MTIFQSIIIGIVEGITEYLPVSSTAHIVLAMHFFGIESDSPFATTYNIVIQSAPILAVAAVFFERLNVFSKQKLAQNYSIWLKLAVAFIPTGVAGLFLYKYILSLFNSDITVLAMLLTGVAFIIAEFIYRKQNPQNKTADLNDVTFVQAFLVGCVQIVSLVPGISRSGSTIIGGMAVGMDRQVAIRFSFLLALPTMGVATLYSLYKEASMIDSHQYMLMGVGFIAALVSSWIVVKLLLTLISKVSYYVFGIYLLLSAALFSLL